MGSIAGAAARAHPGGMRSDEGDVPRHGPPIETAQADAGSGSAAGVAVFDTEAAFAAARIPSPIEVIRTGGYHSAGDGGGHLKRRITTPGVPAPHQRQAGDGSWWEIASDGAFSFLWFGARADYDEETRAGTDNGAAWADFIGALGATLKDGFVPAGAYFGISAPGTIPDAAIHDVPQVAASKILLRGAGSALTRLVARRAATAAFPRASTSRPMLKSVSAVHFELTGFTLDGGFRAFSEVGGSLGKGSDPQAAALLEVRNASRVHIDDVVATGFAGNWDDRTPENGNYGRRGPILIAACTNVDAKVRLQHPTFREGIFFHDCVRARIAFDYVGPADASGSPVSTPLHVMGPNTGSVEIGPFRASGAWRGSVCNVGGKGLVAVRDVRIMGKIGALNDTTGDARTASGTDTWGKGFDFGSEHQEDFFAGHPRLERVVVDGFVAENCFSYALRGLKRPGTRGGHASLSGVVIHNSFEGINFEEWERIDLDARVDGVLRYVDSSASNGYGLRFVGVDGLAGKAAGDGSLQVPHIFPNAVVPSVGTTRFSRFGVLLQRTNAVLSLRTADWRAAHVLYDIAETGEDDRYTLDLDIAATTFLYATPSEAPFTFIHLGVSGTQRLKHLRLRGSFDGATLVGHPQVTTNAVIESIA